jgi:hypothetical protein
MNHTWNEKETLLNVDTYESTLIIKPNIGLRCKAFSRKLAANSGALKRYGLCSMVCWQCISIRPCNESQIDALFNFSLFPFQTGKQSTRKYNTYKLLYIYNIPPDDGLQICPKHVEVEWRNKLRINNASIWLSLQGFFTKMQRHRSDFLLIQTLYIRLSCSYKLKKGFIDHRKCWWVKPNGRVVKCKWEEVKCR